MGNRDHLPKNPHVAVPVRSPQWSHTANWATWPWVLHGHREHQGFPATSQNGLAFLLSHNSSYTSPPVLCWATCVLYVPHSPQPPKNTQDKSCCCNLFSVPYEDTVSQTPPAPYYLAWKEKQSQACTLTGCRLVENHFSKHLLIYFFGMKYCFYTEIAFPQQKSAISKNGQGFSLWKRYTFQSSANSFPCSYPPCLSFQVSATKNFSSLQVICNIIRTKSAPLATVWLLNPLPKIFSLGGQKKK